MADSNLFVSRVIKGSSRGNQEVVKRPAKRLLAKLLGELLKALEFSYDLLVSGLLGNLFRSGKIGSYGRDNCYG